MKVSVLFDDANNALELFVSCNLLSAVQQKSRRIINKIVLRYNQRFSSHLNSHFQSSSSKAMNFKSYFGYFSLHFAHLSVSLCVKFGCYSEWISHNPVCSACSCVYCLILLQPISEKCKLVFTFSIFFQVSQITFMRAVHCERRSNTCERLNKSRLSLSLLYTLYQLLRRSEV